jgi:hypothetical protein
MNTHFPDYYQDFKCIADKCRHTCCAGWEIDVDDDSLVRFKDHPDIMKNISGNSIILKEDERCPFLLENGLCDMILKHGEDFLCDICTEHPRFYNDYGDHIEGGIGLVCEEACRIILDKEDDFTLIPPMPLSPYISLVFNTDEPLSVILSKLKSDRCSPVTRASFIKTLEVLDPAWTVLMDKITADPPTFEEEDKVIDSDSRRFRNFCAYLLYRYDDQTGFAVESAYLLADAVLKGVDIHEAARMFSGEIEYSDINIDTALEASNRN